MLEVEEFQNIYNNNNTQDSYGLFLYRNAKSLVKHLLVADVTKRYGCLKNGANDIKNHRWFKNLDWYKLSQRKVPAPYIPQISKAGDTSNFSEYPDSDTMSPEVSKKDDPFLDW